MVGALALMLLGLGIRALPAAPGSALAVAPGSLPEARDRVPADGVPTDGVPADRVPTDSAAAAEARAYAAHQQVEDLQSQLHRPTEPPTIGEFRPVAVPATGPGRYVYAHQKVSPSSRHGKVKRYDVRVEQGLEIDADEAALRIQQVLNDQRSWGGTGRWRFQLVSGGQSADLHLYIVTPGTTDRLCRPLKTRGEVSCRSGSRVVLNAKRWLRGVTYYDGDLANYQRYLVNHEVGHALGFNHVRCPRPGRLAPVMMQQTKGLGGCRKNPWPRPDG